MDTLDLDIKRVYALHAIACSFARLKWLAAATRLELAMDPRSNRHLSDSPLLSKKVA